MTSLLTKALTSQPKRHRRTVEAAASCIKLDSFLRQPMTTCPGNGPSQDGRAGLDQSPTDMAAGEYDLGVSSVEAVLSGLTVIQLCPGPLDRDCHLRYLVLEIWASCGPHLRLFLN